MQKTRNPCQAHLESVDNPLIHYFVTLTTAPDNIACYPSSIRFTMCSLYSSRGNVHSVRFNGAFYRN